MSDNLCGPSNALKSLGDHVDRDRSIHQDRAGAGQAGSSNFRSAPNVNPNVEADYQAFLNRGLAPLSLMPMDHDPRAFIEPGAPAHQQHLRGMHGPGIHGPRGPQGIHGSGAGPAQHSQWAAEFAANSAGAGAGAGAGAVAGPAYAASARAPLSGHLYNQQPLQAVNRLQHFSMGVTPGPIYTPPGFANPSSNFAQAPSLINRGPGFTSTSTASTTTTTTTTGMVVNDPSAPSGVGNLTEAQLEARFAAAQLEMDFEDEMNSWMATHGPTAADAVAAEEQQIDEELNYMANELDAQRSAEATAAAAAGVVTETETDAARLSAAETLAEEAKRVAAAEQDREEEELARIAGTIVNTLSANPDNRFQESSFLRLMRRIETREVTVRGDSLVEGATGLPVEVVVMDKEAENAQQSQQSQQKQQHQGV